MSEALFAWLWARSLWEWMALSLVGNVAIFVGSVWLCQWLWRRFPGQPLMRMQQPISRRDMGLSAGAVLLNSLVAVVGFGLWKSGWIRLTHPGAFRTLGDVLMFLLAMDLSMYVFHRIAHLPPLFRLLHAPHHVHENTNALSLFVLHPAEVLGFGALMIAVMMLLPMSLNRAVLDYASRLRENTLYNFYAMGKTSIERGNRDTWTANPRRDEAYRFRVDDKELRREIQGEVEALWPTISNENLNEVSDFRGFRADFLRLFGFGVGGVDAQRGADARPRLGTRTLAARCAVGTVRRGLDQRSVDAASRRADRGAGGSEEAGNQGGADSAGQERRRQEKEGRRDREDRGYGDRPRDGIPGHSDCERGDRKSVV